MPPPNSNRDSTDYDEVLEDRVTGYGDKATEYGIRVAAGPKPAQKRTSKPSAKPASSDKQISDLMKDLKKFFLQEFGKYMPQKTQRRMPKFTVIPDKDMKETERKHTKANGDYLLKQTQKFNPNSLEYLLKSFYYPDPVPYTIDEKTQFKPKDKAYLIRNIIAGDILDTHRGKTVTIAFYSDREDKIYLSESRVSTAVFAAGIEKPAGTIAHEMAHAFSDFNWYILTRIMLRAKGGGILDEGMTAHRVAHLAAREWALKQTNPVPIPDTGYTSEAKYRDRADDFVSQVGEAAAFEAFFGGWIDWDDDDHPENALVIGKRNVKAKDAKKSYTTWKWPW